MHIDKVLNHLETLSELPIAGPRKPYSSHYTETPQAGSANWTTRKYVHIIVRRHAIGDAIPVRYVFWLGKVQSTSLVAKAESTATEGVARKVARKGSQAS